MTTKAQSAVARIEAFYEQNPHEWLTWDDALMKFDIPTKAKAVSLIDYMNRTRGFRIEAVTVLRRVDPE